jgi:hypothetical protein
VLCCTIILAVDVVSHCIGRRGSVAIYQTQCCAVSLLLQLYVRAHTCGVTGYCSDWVNTICVALERPSCEGVMGANFCAMDIVDGMLQPGAWRWDADLDLTQRECFGASKDHNEGVLAPAAEHQLQSSSTCHYESETSYTLVITRSKRACATADRTMPSIFLQSSDPPQNGRTCAPFFV